MQSGEGWLSSAMKGRKPFPGDSLPAQQAPITSSATWTHVPSRAELDLVLDFSAAPATISVSRGTPRCPLPRPHPILLAVVFLELFVRWRIGFWCW